MEDKTRIIVLTVKTAYGEHERRVRIRVSAISSYHKAFGANNTTMVYLIGSPDTDAYEVQETPEQIDEMLGLGAGYPTWNQCIDAILAKYAGLTLINGTTLREEIEAMRRS